MLFGIAIVVLAIAAFEIPPLVRKGWWKELAVFILLLLAGTGLSVAKVLNATIPNPLDLVTVVYKPISDAVMNYLKS